MHGCAQRNALTRSPWSNSLPLVSQKYSSATINPRRHQHRAGLNGVGDLVV
jgi:hypothetical protein